MSQHFFAGFQINELDGEIVSYGIAIIVTGVVLRILATIAVGFGDGLNTKEKVTHSIANSLDRQTH